MGFGSSGFILILNGLIYLNEFDLSIALALFALQIASFILKEAK